MISYVIFSHPGIEDKKMAFDKNTGKRIRYFVSELFLIENMSEKYHYVDKISDKKVNVTVVIHKKSDLQLIDLRKKHLTFQDDLIISFEPQNYKAYKKLEDYSLMSMGASSDTLMGINEAVKKRILDALFLTSEDLKITVSEFNY